MMADELPTELFAPFLSDIFSVLILRNVKLVDVVSELVKKKFGQRYVASKSEAQQRSAPLFFEVV
jgi:hypothetical protein